MDQRTGSEGPTNDPTDGRSIILIGPMCSGKSSTARLLSDRLGLPLRQLDELRWEYYREIGYDPAHAERLVHGPDGFEARFNYWTAFEAYAVERLLVEYSHSVLDFGAGNSVYDNPDLLRRVKHALAPFCNVLLLLPSPDPDESVRILNQRLSRLLIDVSGEAHTAVLRLNERFIRHPSNHQLATMTMYTGEMDPEMVCQEIVSRLEL